MHRGTVLNLINAHSVHSVVDDNTTNLFWSRSLHISPRTYGWGLRPQTPYARPLRGLEVLDAAVTVRLVDPERVRVDDGRPSTRLPAPRTVATEIAVHHEGIFLIGLLPFL